MGAFALLFPLLPSLVKMVLDITAAIRADTSTPEATKVKLDALSAELKIVATKVAAVELPSGNP